MSYHLSIHDDDDLINNRVFDLRLSQSGFRIQILTESKHFVRGKHGPDIVVLRWSCYREEMRPVGVCDDTELRHVLTALFGHIVRHISRQPVETTTDMNHGVYESLTLSHSASLRASMTMIKMAYFGNAEYDSILIH